MPFSGTYLEAVRLALHDALAADPAVCLLGEDIGGYGGAFKATEGLQAEFGADRVLDTPIAEQAIAGAAVGLALMGQRPVAEFQFMDFALLGSDLIVNFAAKTRWRWGAACPAVFRGPVGAGSGGGPFHSQSPEAHFLPAPGLKVVAPGTVADAYALLRASIDDPDPVLFLEHKLLYRRLRDAWEVPPTARLGEAALRRDGGRAAVVTYGAVQHRALAALEGLDAAVLDLRTLKPWDREAVAALVRRTGRVLVLTEAAGEFGPGAEVAAWIGEACFPWLDAPVRRLAGRDTPTPAGPALEAAWLPSEAAIRAAVEGLLAW